jgi:hypothetical protein
MYILVVGTQFCSPTTAAWVMILLSHSNKSVGKPRIGESPKTTQYIAIPRKLIINNNFLGALAKQVLGNIKHVNI